MGYVLLFLAVWLVLCLPALIYAGIIEARRRRDVAAVEEKFRLLGKNLELLEQRLRTMQTAAPAATTSHVQPEVHILSQPFQTVQPAPAHTAAPAYAPLTTPAPKPPAPERTVPSAPVLTPPPATLPQPVPAPAAVQAICTKCGAGLPVGARFCARCWAIVEPSKPAATAPTVQAQAAEAAARVTPLETKPAQPTPPFSATAAPATPRVPVAPVPPVPPRPVQRPVQPPPAVRMAAPPAKKPKGSFEERLGMRWFPIVGVAIVVMGVGFLVGSQWQVFPHWLRVLILYTGGLGLLMGGIFLERKGRYRVLGRALIGGSWAVTALITYAIANTQPLLVLSSKNVDLFLLLAVIGAMVWHTLKYESQLVTGAAFLLGFVAIGMNPSAPYNLIAGGMLITGMTVIVLRGQWFELEIFGILASYLNHFYWLYRVYEQQGQRATFEYHSASVGLVIGYWVVFRASYLLRKVSGKQQEAVATFAGLLNPILFLGVMKYQGFHPEWAWKVLLAMGAVEFILGQLPVSRRRSAPFQVLSSLGAALMLASVFLKYSGNSLDIVWLAGAEAFLLAGIFTRERLFRGFGLIISFLVALHAVPVRIFPLAQQVLNAQPHHDGQISLVLLVIAAVLYANAHVSRRLWPELFADELESQSLSVLSFVASLFAVAAAYAYVPDHIVAVALAAFVAWLSGTGKLFSISEMVYEAHWVAAVPFLQVIGNDRSLETQWLHLPQRVLVFTSVAALFYLGSRFVRLSETAGKAVFFAGYAWAATSLLTLLIWFQATDWAAAVLWIALALALSIAAHVVKRSDFRWQAFVLVLLSAGRGLVVNFNLTQAFHSITYRLISVSIVALGIYLLARWAPLKAIRPVYTVIGTLLLAVLAYKETATPWTAVAWISLALLLCLAARLWKDRPLLWQTHVLAALALAWTLYTNFAPEYRQTRLQLLTVGITVALFYVLNWTADIAGIIADSRISYAYSWAGSLLLSWLAWYQLDAANVALAWGILGVVLFELPDLLGAVKVDCSRSIGSWRGQAYIALVFGFAHIFYTNFNSPPAGNLLQVLRDPHVLTVLPLPFVYFYVYWRSHSESRVQPAAKAGAWSSKRVPEYLMACLGTATVAALVRFEAQPEWVAAGYATLLVALLALAWRAGQEIFLYQAIVMLGFTAFRTAIYNFYHLSGAFSASLTSSIWTIALLACGIPLAFLVRKTLVRRTKPSAIPPWASVFALHPEQPMFFVPVILLAVLLFLKLSGGKVTGAWGLEGFAVFVLALWAKERSFRWTGLSLLLLSICKLVYDTFYFDNPQVRYITWIGVGILILVVAFLYGKNREALREYL